MTRNAEHGRKPTHLVASNAAMDYFAAGIDPQDIPRSILRRAAKLDGSSGFHSKVLMPLDEIDAHQAALEARGATILKRGGGNLSIGVRIAALLDEGQVRIRSWVGKDNDGKFLKNELRESRNVEPVISEFEWKTPRGLVIPINTPKGLDRVIFSFKQPDMPSDFVQHIPEHLHFAVVNSLYGPDWAANMEAGIDKLTGDNTRYVDTPGSPQLEAVTYADDPAKRDPEKIRAVYKAVQHAEVLSLDLHELKTLLVGVKHVGGEMYHKEILDGAPMEALLKEGQRALGSKVIVVTDGRHGAWGYDSLHDPQNVWHVAMAPDPDQGVVNTIGAGDAFTAAAALEYFQTGDIKRSIEAGSVNGAIATGAYGAREILPSRDELNERRMRNGSPEPNPVRDGDRIAA